MINEETYKKELVRMWDTLRADKYKGECSCKGVRCGNCPLSVEYNDIHNICANNINAFRFIKIVEKWSEEHPQKFKVSKLEFDILEADLEGVWWSDYLKFSDLLLLGRLLKKGYFNGATNETNVKYYFDNCEVVDDDTDKRQK